MMNYHSFKVIVINCLIFFIYNQLIETVVVEKPNFKNIPRLFIENATVFSSASLENLADGDIVVDTGHHKKILCHWNTAPKPVQDFATKKSRSDGYAIDVELTF